MKKLKILAAFLSLSVLLTACAISDNKNKETNSGNEAEASEESEESEGTASSEKTTESSVSDTSAIDLDDMTGIIRITDGGTYSVTGTSSDATILIDVSEKEEVGLILEDASITSTSSAAVYVLSAGNVTITLKGDNYLSNGGTFEAIDENDIDAVIFAKDDLTVDGDGTLTISSPSGHGIVCKDSMMINGGTFTITASEDGINTNDSLTITAGDITIDSGDDAIHTDSILQIDDGSFVITAAEGLEATYITINGGTFTISASDDGINAAQKSDEYTPTVEINGGEITITMAQGDTDGIDSNGDIIINGGTVDITGQFACDYDGTAELNGGTLIINGEEVDTIPNQFMNGGMPGGMTFPNGESPDGMPSGDGELPDIPGVPNGGPNGGSNGMPNGTLPDGFDPSDPDFTPPDFNEGDMPPGNGDQRPGKHNNENEQS